PPAEPVRRPAARDVAENTQQQGQSSEEPELRAREPADLLEVGGKPGDHEVETVPVGEVRGAERRDAPASDQGAPAEPAVAGGRQPAFRLDLAALGGADGPMLPRLVAEPAVPAPSPEEPDRAEENEDRPPGQPAREPEDEKRRDAPREMRAREEYSLDR